MYWLFVCEVSASHSSLDWVETSQRLWGSFTTCVHLNSCCWLFTVIRLITINQVLFSHPVVLFHVQIFEVCWLQGFLISLIPVEPVFLWVQDILRFQLIMTQFAADEMMSLCSVCPNRILMKLCLMWDRNVWFEKRFCLVSVWVRVSLIRFKSRYKIMS